MKTIIITSFLIFFALNLIAQKDTLVVPLGKYGFVKIGDKIYKINITLDPVVNPPALLRTGTLIWPGNEVPATNGMRLSDGHDIDPGFNQGGQAGMIILSDGEMIRHKTN